MTTKNFYFISQLFHVMKTFFRFRWCAHHRRGRGNSENVLYPPPTPGGGPGGSPRGGLPRRGCGAPVPPPRARGGCGYGGSPRGVSKYPLFQWKTPPFEVQKFAFNFEIFTKKCVFSTCPKNRNFALFDPPTPKMCTFLKFCTFLHFFAKIAFFHFFALFSLFGGVPPCDAHF